jgi:hypothetical protein
MEIRVARGYRSPADVDEMIMMMTDRVSKLAPEVRFVIAADWRGVVVMSPETTARVRAMLSRVNARVERSAILTLPEQPTANLQVQRLVRESENANRRHFVAAGEQCKWLSEILTPTESRRLSEFLEVAEKPSTP